jgi:hypothetical protein
MFWRECEGLDPKIRVIALQFYSMLPHNNVMGLSNVMSHGIQVAIFQTLLRSHRSIYLCHPPLVMVQHSKHVIKCSSTNQSWPWLTLVIVRLWDHIESHATLAHQV